MSARRSVENETGHLLSAADKVALNCLGSHTVDDVIMTAVVRSSAGPDPELTGHTHTHTHTHAALPG